MLRTLLITLAAGVCLQTQAQTVAPQPLQVAKKATHAAIKPQGLTNNVQVVSGNEAAATQANPVTHPAAIDHSSAQRSVGTVIGTTTYDLQSNYGMGRRVFNDNGTIYATWTRSSAQDDSYADRGTGLNTSTNGGLAWGAAPTARIESVRCGWPTMGVTANGRRFITTHTGAAGLLFTYRDAGATSWSAVNVGTDNGDLTGVWNRAAVSGNNIHVVISRQDEYDGIVGGLAYFRSTDGGTTWDGPTPITDAAGNSLIPQSYTSVNADAYFLEANGNHLALVLGEYGREITLYESMNNGDSWTKRTIQATSNPLFPDEPTDEDDLDPAVVSGGGQTIVIDNNDVVHVWFDRVFNYDDAGDGQIGPFYLPNSSCIMYWNSTMNTSPVVIGRTVRQDYNGDGTTALDTQVDETQSYGVSIVSQPSAGMDASGNLYVAYSSLNDGDIQANRQGTGSQRLYRDVYIVKSTDGGATWVGPYNVTDTPNKEEVFPSIAKNVDGFVHLIYQEDDSTGTYLQNTNGNGQATWSINNVVYVGVPPSAIVNPPLVDTNPEISYLNVPYAYQDCPVSADRFDASVLDYPDGELPITVGGTVDITTPNDTGDGYGWVLSATDSDGNTASQDFIDTNTGLNAAIIVYEDVTAPTIFGQPVEFFFDDAGDEFYNSLFDPYFVEVDVLQNTAYTDLGAVARDDAEGFGCPAVLTTQNSVNTAVLGSYNVTYNATDNAGNAAEAVVRTVNVIGADTDAPVIYAFDLDGNLVDSGSTLELQADPGGTYIDPGYFTIDNVDGDLTDVTLVSGSVDLAVPGTYTLTYSATDAAGNNVTFTRIVTVADTEAPSITLGGPSTIAWTNCNAPFVEPAGTTAFDAVDGNLTSSIVISGTVNTGCGGSYLLTYTVTDAAGNSSSKTRTVIVAATCQDGCSSGLDNVVALNGTSVYPNPSVGIINIAIPNTINENVSVKVYNTAGAVVHTANQQINNGGVITADLSALPAGNYYASITVKAGTRTESFIISK